MAKKKKSKSKLVSILDVMDDTDLPVPEFLERMVGKVKGWSSKGTLKARKVIVIFHGDDEEDKNVFHYGIYANTDNQREVVNILQEVYMSECLLRDPPEIMEDDDEDDGDESA